MVFLTKTSRQTVEDALLLLQTNTNITKLSPGGKARAILDIVGAIKEESYQEFDLALARSFISAANGQNLDLFGILLGEPRLPSVAAKADASMEVVKFYAEEGTFGDINGGNSIPLPRGTIVSTRANGEGLTYRLSTPLTLDASDTSAWASVEAFDTGSEYNVGANSLIYHNFTDYEDYLNKTLLVTNIYAIGSGKDFEGDNNYKYRLVQKVIEGEAANETALRLAALSVPGVADVLMQKHYRGIGTFGIIIKSVTPTISDNLIDEVIERVIKKEGYSSVRFIRGQRQVGFAMKTRVWYKKRLDDDELDDIEGAMEDIVRNHVNNLDLGETLFTDRLIAELYSASEEIEGFGTRAQQLDEAWIYKPTELEDNRIPQRLIGNYEPPIVEERVIIEPSLSSPIIFERRYGSRPAR